MSILSIDVRRARTEDAAEIAAVHDAAWRYAYRGILRGIDLERMIQRRGPAWWEKALRRNVLMLVIEVQHRIVGYATLGPSRMHNLPFAGEIYELYVTPEFQGLGLGRRLFEAAFETLDRIDLKGLAVRAVKANDLAVGFYEHLGGRPVAEAGETIGDRELAVAIFGWPPINAD